MKRVSFILGGGLVSLVVLAALVSTFWTPHPTDVISIANRFQPPSASHWLGTDQLGRDLLSLLMEGAQSSVIVAFLSVGLGGSVGAALGLLAAARGGMLEELVMRCADLAFAFPALLFAIMLAAIYGPSLTNAVLAIAFINVPVFARLGRAAANQIWVRDYVTAARAMGLSTFRITWRHVGPNVAAILVVQITIEFAIAILAEAALSYLGLGVQPPIPSWGRMLSEAQTLLFIAPQLAIWPGVCIVIAVLGFNLLGDGLRDATDPRLRTMRR
ncbi:ABC transporter permease [Minwuia sp.]|uniref:ABC transporter permease n=1 Tax=Minwuia sp. TaxID=2493630 RepID=UPI003A8F05C7